MQMSLTALRIAERCPSVWRWPMMTKTRSPGPTRFGITYLRCSHYVSGSSGRESTMRIVSTLTRVTRLMRSTM